MTPLLVSSIVLGYFFLLILISRLTSKTHSSNETFFTGDRSSVWYVVAFGMIGASLSGVTFISVPGWVGASSFSYFQVVLGYFFGYLLIGRILLPLYYRLQLVSIYEYLASRFGFYSHKTGALFFILSRVIGASFRLFLVAGVLQMLIFDQWGMPFSLTVSITIVLIWVYTYRGGIKTIVWTDTLQTFFMIISVLITIVLLIKNLKPASDNWIQEIQKSDLSTLFFWDWKESKFFIKQFVAGIFIAIVMTGLDQDMMQKNLTCRSLKDAQKNMFWFSIVLLIVNFVFLILGALLYRYAAENNISIPPKSDFLFPLIATDYLPEIAGIFFILGIIAAAYSSADSALTSLTTSFCIDILDIHQKELSPSDQKNIRLKVHLFFSVILIIVVILFNKLNDENVISALFKAAGFTYGPLLGLYAFGLFSSWKIKDKWVPYVCVLAPSLSFLIFKTSKNWLWGYEFGFEILIVNGLLTFLGLMLIRKPLLFSKTSSV